MRPASSCISWDSEEVLHVFVDLMYKYFMIEEIKEKKYTNVVFKGLGSEFSWINSFEIFFIAILIPWQ